MVDVAVPLDAAPRERRALPAVWIAVLLWSATSLFVRAGDADPLVFTAWRLLFSLPPLAVILAVRARGGHAIEIRPPGVSPRRWALVVLGAGAFFATAAGSAFIAIDKTRLLDVTLIGALQPVVIIVVAVIFLGERLQRSHVVCSAIAVAGTALVAMSASGSGSWSLAGELIAIASLFLNAGWYLYGRVVRDRHAIDPFAFMLGVLAAAAVLLTPVAWISAGSLAMSGGAYLWAAATMAAGTAAHVLVVWAHRYLPASVSAPLLLAEPPLVADGAWIFFAESLNAVQILGAVVVLTALWGMVRSPAVTNVEDESVDPAPAT